VISCTGPVKHGSSNCGCCTRLRSIFCTLVIVRHSAGQFIATYIGNFTSRCAVCALKACICGSALGRTGRHGLSCRKSAGRLSRHGAFNDIIKRALSSEVPHHLEPPSPMLDDGKGPDGMSKSPWSNSRCLGWDFTSPNNLAHSRLNSAVC
jgi:hypothetical protein